MKISGTVYQCDQCGIQEVRVPHLLNWITIRTLRDEIAPTRCSKMWRRDFCSRQCLVMWGTSEPEVIDEP